MLIDIPRIKYFGSCLAKKVSGQSMACPSCGNSESQFVQRKYWVTELRRCANCRLMYRYPKDSSPESAAFYDSEYKQVFTTDLPSAPALETLLHSAFKGHEKDYGDYIEAIRAIGVENGARLLDFGASWGYGTWQLSRAGFDVQGYEISGRRAKYGRERLRVDLTHRLEEVTGPFDVFFSSHVLEHLPSVSAALRLARRVLRPGGLFVAFTPNGSKDFRRVDPRAFEKLWSRVHPNFLDDKFYKRAFEGHPLLLASPPYDFTKMRAWDKSASIDLELGGSELLAVAVL